jgi:hypothetical protein
VESNDRQIKHAIDEPVPVGFGRLIITWRWLGTTITSH